MSDMSSMRTLPPHKADPTAICVSNLRINFPGSTMRRYGAYIFSGSSNGAHTTPDEIVKVTYIEFMISLYTLITRARRFVPMLYPRHTKYVWYIDFVASTICEFLVKILLLIQRSLLQRFQSCDIEN